MPTRKMLKSRKAISPILATLLLIVIAVAAIVVTYAWVMTYMSSTTHQAEVMLYKANVNFYTNSTKKIDIDIGNSGTKGTQITAIYIGTSPSSTQSQTPIQQFPISLEAKQIATATINYNWTAGTTYYFKVISASGQRLGDPDPWPEQAPAP